MQQLVLLGPPGSGKGTQANRLATHFGLLAYSTGVVLRQEEAKSTPLGREIHNYLKVGSYVPDELILVIVRNALESAGGKCVLDGFPRTLAQGQALDHLIGDLGCHEPFAIHLEVDQQVLESRVRSRVGCDGCGLVWANGEQPASCPSCDVPVASRIDDSQELYRARLAEYQKKTLPLLPFYEGKNRLHRVCGEGSPDAVFGRILAALL